ncbi:MAG TPA: hypothetical protein VGD56_12935 [Gemmatirosa sp.]
MPGAPATAQAAATPPRDTPTAFTSRADEDAMRAALAPAVAQARRTYPAARARYLRGLPAGHHFFVAALLRDDAGHTEQAFVAVDSVARGRVFGRIASDIGLVRGYRSGDPYTLAETELLDWTVQRPDGSEEGNAVGLALEAYQAHRRIASVGTVPFDFTSADENFAVTGTFAGTVRVRGDRLEVLVTRAVARAHPDVPATAPLRNVRLRADLVTHVDSTGNWIVVDSSAYALVAASLAGSVTRTVGPLRFVLPRSQSGPLASYWVAFEFEAVAPARGGRPAARFATFAHGNEGMFAGYR